jgi:hypothetical protein
MSTRKKPSNFIGRLSRKIWRFFNTITKAFITWFLRNVLVVQRRARLSQTGFVLPTVVMMILVVTLLTTAILLRSFDRTKNASNYRVNEAVLNAAAPALDRSRAKLNRLFSPDETRIAGNKPSNEEIASALEDARYTFGDEVQLKLAKDLNGNGVQANEDNERLKSAWMFPTDTDNNGKFDSFTLYGVYFRTPPVAANPTDNRARGPLEARARPQSTGGADACAAGNAGGDEGGDDGSGWFNVDAQSKKAFFTYVATIPISQPQFAQLQGSGYKDNSVPGNKFEAYTGNKGFSALEMQQDQARLAVDNNAVFYEDDLLIQDVPEGGFKLNGRVQVNGNLMAGSGNVPYTGDITFYQVSSPWSCYYNAENGKIIVGGNVAANGIGGNTDTNNLANGKVKVHLYKQRKQPFIAGAAGNTFSLGNDGNVTTTEVPKNMAYNPRAYAQRLNVLVQGGMSEYDASNTQPPTPGFVAAVATYPQEIKENFTDAYKPGLKGDDARNLLERVIETYFRERIRKVPFAEVKIDDPPRKALEVGGTPVSGYRALPNYVFNGMPQIKPPDAWRPIDPASTKVNLKYTGTTMELDQSNPQPPPAGGTETLIGDRILVGNGLPNFWLKPDGTESKDAQPVGNGIEWNAGGGARERKSRVKVLEDLGDTSRGGFWERVAADPANVPGSDPADQELAGGLRIVTGAGIYVDEVPPLRQGTGLRRDPSHTTLQKAQERSFLPKPFAELSQAQLLAKLHTLNFEIPATPRPLQPVSVVWPDTMPMYLWEDKPPMNAYNGPLNRDVFKGDLQMRATVVYHYNSPTPDQPVACISSYYDPTNFTTAKNSSTDDPINGDVLGVSNNGLNYQPPTAAQRVLSPRLRRQAYMVFPDGRWVNEPLKNAVAALQGGTAPGDLSLEQKAAIDAANCAFGILDGTLARTASPVPDNAIRERAFLDARQVKTLHKPDVEFDADGFTFTRTNPTIDRQTILRDANGKVLIADPEQMKIATQATLNDPVNPKNPAPAEYSLPIEQRQPLEVRVTEIDLEQLRTTTFGTTPKGVQEYLLPNSGIIYASRDDALPDITDVNIRGRRQLDGGGSATDFKLDPSRRPNGVRIWSSDNNRGGRLSRGTTNVDRPEERGLILASNLPVYIKGDFNRHFVFGSNNPTEEFRTQLGANYTDDQFYNRRPPFDRNFASRQKGAGPVGDQWRTARVLADAVTLLSNNFRDGFREEGDYNLNNNAGNMVVAARLKNGFWWNGFATDYIYKDAGGTAINPQYPVNAVFEEQDPVNPATETSGSSYAMNSVTPIQRRANFPQYLMEACDKALVSECSPQDWYVGGPTRNNLRKASEIINQALPARNPSGTTVRPPDGIFKNAPRRVAFNRNEFGQLVLPDTCTANPANTTGLQNCDAIPLGINSNQVTPYPFKEAGTTATASPPPAADNALWFWTTSDNTNANPSSASPSYDKNNLLYYLPDDPEIVAAPAVATERQMLLPGIPKFPPELATTFPALADPARGYMSVLNGNTANDPSDFSVCVRGIISKDYKAQTSTFGGTCPQAPIRQMWTALYGLTDNPATFTKVSPLTITPGVTEVAVPATTKVNVFDLSSNALTNLKFTFQKNSQSDPIFVIRGVRTGGPLAQRITFTNNVTLELNGVDPNNIFWVSNRGMQVVDNTSQLAGNFIGGVGNLNIADGTAIKGGRFLGFLGNNHQIGSPITALTTTNQPLLVPVLQLHSAEGTPSDTPGTAFASSNRNPVNRKWLQRATETNYNAVLVTGDTPARPFSGPGVTQGGEDNGGLHNFPRFIENWTGVNATIKGSLIQYIKSKYATAPFETVDLIAQDNSLFFDSAPNQPPAYIVGSNPAVDTLGYQYPEGAADNKSAFYQPPNRIWGYDVGLLSQRPDLFSKRLAIPEAGTPNEFFREVSKDDPWVQTLMCAAQGSGTNYAWAITDPKQRPSACQTATPGADYNDV